MSKFLRTARLLTLLAILPVAACSSSQQPIRVLADMADLARLRGAWYGEYGSAETGRNGTIDFTLEAGKDWAYGSVVMSVRYLETPLQFPEQIQGPQLRWKIFRNLTVNFVAVDDGMIRGTMDPYLDPLCNCTVTTTFEGKIDKDSISGTYSTMTSTLGPATKGIWKANRKKSNPVL
jgi:hypothetical protein